jgi:hypothetical protein
LVNPFLGLSDPGSMEGKIGSLKDSGARCWLKKIINKENNKQPRSILKKTTSILSVETTQ